MATDTHGKARGRRGNPAGNNGLAWPASLLGLLLLTLAVAVVTAPAQDEGKPPEFTDLTNREGANASSGEGELDRGIAGYSRNTVLQADVNVKTGNIDTEEVFFARPERYPWRLSSVISIEFAKFLQKAGRELRREVGDLEKLEPATLHYLRKVLPSELESTMKHIVVQQQLFSPDRQILQTDPEYRDGTRMPPAFYTDGKGALEVLKRLGRTFELSLLSRESVLYDVVTAILMSRKSPVRQPLGELLDPARFPPRETKDDITTRLGKEGLPRVVVSIGGYTIGALGILSYQLAKGGLLGYDVNFGRLKLSKSVLKTDKYGFGWRIDTEGFGFDNAHAGLEFKTRNVGVAVLAGGKVRNNGGDLFSNEETTVLASYKIFGSGGTESDVNSALTLLGEARVPWDGGEPRFGVGALYHHSLNGASTVEPRELVIEGHVTGPTSEMDWQVNATYMVDQPRKRRSYFMGVGIGTQEPIPQRTLDEFDRQRFHQRERDVRGYVFFGINF